MTCGYEYNGSCGNDFLTYGTYFLLILPCSYFNYLYIYTYSMKGEGALFYIKSSNIRLPKTPPLDFSIP